MSRFVRFDIRVSVVLDTMTDDAENEHTVWVSRLDFSFTGPAIDNQDGPPCEVRVKAYDTRSPEAAIINALVRARTIAGDWAEAIDAFEHLRTWREMVAQEDEAEGGTFQ